MTVKFAENGEWNENRREEPGYKHEKKKKENNRCVHACFAFT